MDEDILDKIEKFKDSDRILEGKAKTIIDYGNKIKTLESEISAKEEALVLANKRVEEAERRESQSSSNLADMLKDITQKKNELAEIKSDNESEQQQQQSSMDLLQDKTAKQLWRFEQVKSDISGLGKDYNEKAKKIRFEIEELNKKVSSLKNEQDRAKKVIFVVTPQAEELSKSKVSLINDIQELKGEAEQLALSVAESKKTLQEAQEIEAEAIEKSEEITLLLKGKVSEIEERDSASIRRENESVASKKQSDSELENVMSKQIGLERREKNLKYQNLRLQKILQDKKIDEKTVILEKEQNENANP